MSIRLYAKQSRSFERKQSDLTSFLGLKLSPYCLGEELGIPHRCSVDWVRYCDTLLVQSLLNYSMQYFSSLSLPGTTITVLTWEIVAILMLVSLGLVKICPIASTKKKQATLETDLPNCHNPHQVQLLSLICHFHRCCISDGDESPVRETGTWYKGIIRI